MKKIVLLTVVLLLLAVPAIAKFDPDFTWNTLETPHFLIHYHQGGEALAKKTAQIAEDVHARLAPRIKRSGVFNRLLKNDSKVSS